MLPDGQLRPLTGGLNEALGPASSTKSPALSTSQGADLDDLLIAVPTGGVLQVGPLTLNTAEYAVGKEGRRLKLSVTEFKLLHHLMINAGQVVRTTALLHHVWGYEDPDGAEVVRVALHRLRRKLEDDPARPRFLHTVAGVGVMLKAETGRFSCGARCNAIVSRLARL
jgi:DNA-binding response OmpR family regulator